MTKDGRNRGPEGREEDGEKRRLRLHPREGREHRFRFARRWDSKRRSRTGLGLWRILFIDVFAIVLLYLLGRQILQRITG